MVYDVKLEVFEGPLDLLLYLIQRNEIDIYHIPIALITRQFLESLTEMERLNLEVAGEFFVMAATLMRLKARQLLPPAPGEGEPEGEEGDELIQTEEQLVQRLLEYQRYKDVATRLGEVETRARQVFAHGHGLLWSEDEEGTRTVGEVALYDLMRAFLQVLERDRARQRVEEIPLPEVSLEDQMALVRRWLDQEGRLAFSALFARCTNRLELVVTFVALLELVRLKEVTLRQARLFGELWIYPWSQPEPAS